MLCKKFIKEPNREERIIRGMRILELGEYKDDHEQFFYNETTKLRRINKKVIKTISKDTVNLLKDIKKDKGKTSTRPSTLI